MKILIISDEVWDDKLHGNNILTNWFSDFNAEFANIYLSVGKPNNNICSKYFQITDRMVIRSIVKKKQPAGINFTVTSSSKSDIKIQQDERRPKRIYEFMRLGRDLLWYFAKFDIVQLKKFINDFNPDIIFSPRSATIKILKIERLVHKISDSPLVAFTGDAEYTLKKFRLSPIFWLRKLLMRNMFRSNMKFYNKYYLFSKQQLNEYSKYFGPKFEIIHKGYPITESENITSRNDRDLTLPIKIIYAGKIYSNRWKTLYKLGKEINKVNHSSPRFELHIYTKDHFKKNVNNKITNFSGVYIHEAVSSKDLHQLIKEFDIALHVESFDLKNRLQTRLSISTKVADYLASGCALMVIAWKEHSALQYLEEYDSAIIVKKPKLIKEKLNEIIQNKEIITFYRTQAKKLLIKNHDIVMIRKKFYKDFLDITKGDDSFESNSN